MDTDGYVSIHDRLKDMINRGGYKVWSVEVENTLCAHPAVIEAAVVGKPCPVLGERVVAFVHLITPASADELRAHVAAQLSDYKVPEDIHLETAPLPRNANGKLLKRTLRDRMTAPLQAA
jgi:acyl-coenzyme A synthetase/AMP-(fatty) acid ligase